MIAEVISTSEPVIDARGHRCPVPTLKLRRALQTEARVVLLADDPMAQIDVPHFCSHNGFLVETQEKKDDHWFFRVIRVSNTANI